MDEAAPAAARRARRRDRARTSGRPRSRCRRNPSAPGEEREPVAAVAHAARCGRGRRTTTRRPSRTCRPIRSCRTPCARSSSTPSRWSCSASSRPAPTRRSSRSAWTMELVLGPLYEDDDHEYVVWQWAPVGRRRANDERRPRHRDPRRGHAPVGQVGPQLRRVRRGRRAGRARRRGRRVARRAVRLRRRHVRNGYPGYVAGATFAQALGWNGAQVASSYAACASGATALATARAQILAGFCDVALVIGADTTPKGFLAPNKGERGDDPDWLRFRLLGATNPTYFGLYAAPAHGAVRRDPRRLRPREGEERAPRPREPERALPQGSDRSTTCSTRRSSPTRSACSTSARRATARPRSSSRSLDYAQQHGVSRSGARARRSRRSRRATRRPRSSCPNFATDSAAGTGAMPDARLQGVDRGARVRRRPGSAPTISTAPRSTTSRPRWSSTGTSRSGCARRARPRSCSATATRRSAAASR